MTPADLRRHARQTSVIVNDIILAYMRQARRENVADPDVVLDPLFQWRDRCKQLAEMT